jgi:hypothetical protein
VAKKKNITHSSSNFEKKRCHPQKKRVEIPNYTPTRVEKNPRCCRFLLCKHFCDQKVIVMDHEKYFSSTRMNGFWTDDAENTPDAVGKFEPKV